MTATMIGDPDIAPLIQAYHDAAERLKESHEVLHDEVRRLRDELHEKNLELARRERLAALGEMAAGVAHEIRNPLGGIELYASLLERDLAELPAQRRIARQIGVGVKHLEKIVGDILAFAGGREPRRRDCRLAAVLDSALTQAAPQAETLGVEIEVDLRLAQRTLFCDPGQIERAFLNLILNAVEAAGSGGRVWLRAGENRVEDQMTVIVVEDNGPGIAPAQLHRVFNPFFTTKDTGTGLGLAIVHRIVEVHGGSIAAGQRKGGGASFVLQMPAARGMDQAGMQGGSE